MVRGTCDPAFARVGEVFERNFTERGELGASVCVMVDGEPVVDLWGGHVAEGGAEWRDDTVSVVWSATKGATGLCAHLLEFRGQLDLSDRVTDHWPKFGQAGKDALTVADLLSHRSGVSAISTPLPAGAFFDWDTMVTAVEEQAPFFPPGTTHGYQAQTHGWLVGEVVRRVAGVSLGEFFREEIARPLGVDLQIGAREEDESRVAPMVLPVPDPEAPVPDFYVLAADPTSAPGLIMANTGGYMGTDEVGFDSPAAHAAELGATGALTNGRGLARMYAALAVGGSMDGVALVDRAGLARMARPASVGLDDTLRVHTSFTMGYMTSTDNRARAVNARDSMILGPGAFGFPGFGGTLGFADPDHRLSFGYTMNRMGNGVLLNERGQSLVDATYLALGATTDAGGCWV